MDGEKKRANEKRSNTKRKEKTNTVIRWGGSSKIKTNTVPNTEKKIIKKCNTGSKIKSCKFFFKIKCC